MAESDLRRAVAVSMARDLLSDWYDRWRLDPKAEPPHVYLEESEGRCRAVIVGDWQQIGPEPFTGQRCVP